MPMAMSFAMQTSRNLFFDLNFYQKLRGMMKPFIKKMLFDFFPLGNNCIFAINAFMNIETLSKT